MSDTNDPAPTANKMLTLDGLEGLRVGRDEYLNETNCLRSLFMGMRQIATMIKNREADFEQSLGPKAKFVQYGATSDAEREFLDTIACFFHWFGTSLCNYARLVGFIKGLHEKRFLKIDLRDRAKFESIKKSIDAYVGKIDELKPVRVWRNKVFAHFAVTDPFKDDNIATLDMSVIFPVSFDGRYVVGGMKMTRKDSSGVHESQLPRWSITEVFESLEPRFWPGVTFHTNGSVESDAEALIAIAAYYRWENEGRPHGRDKDHWFAAKEQLRRT